MQSILEAAKGGQALPAPLQGWNACPGSVHTLDGDLFFIVRNAGSRALVAVSNRLLYMFEGREVEIQGAAAKLCPLTPVNARALMALFPFTAPVSHKGKAFTIGLGDRLGLASPGHIRTVRGRGVFPVLAQQSIRELKLTGRNYDEVLAAAAFAVFQEDWRGGWGADGDHLKTADEIRYALNCGFTMITLDCSDHIDKAAQGMDAAALGRAYAALPEELRLRYEGRYAGRTFDFGGMEITMGADLMKSIVLTYHKAIDYTIGLYNGIIKPCGRDIDFEMSIDETLCSTAPEAHFVVAGELVAGGVNVVSLAPRFCGEFQKGIDYIGDAAKFEREFILHQKIAAHYGYKLSIHSGSDKFAVFGVIGRHTSLNVHVKTAGTNWLEALRVIARHDAALFREILAFALEHLAEARAYYHIGADPAKVAPQESVLDGKLAGYLDQTDARQVLHITYGLVLQAKNADGSSRFRDRIYSLLYRCEAAYSDALTKHIGRHIDTLEGK